MEEKIEKKSPLKIALDIAYYAVLAIIIFLSVFYMFMTFSTKNGVTSMFGYVVSSVQSGSMSGTFEEGDIIFIKEMDIAETKNIKVNDIVTFEYYESNIEQKIIVTHRVIRFENGKVVTQGDVARKNNSADQIEYISYGDIIGKYEGGRIPALGKAVDFIKSPVGFFICILVPVFLFLFWQIYVFIKTLSEARTLGKEKAINDEARVLAEQMLKEMMAKQTATGEEADSPPAMDNPAEPPAEQTPSMPADTIDDNNDGDQPPEEGTEE